MEAIMFRLFTFISVAILVMSVAKCSTDMYISYDLSQKEEIFRIKLDSKLNECKEMKEKDELMYLIINGGVSISSSPQPSIDDDHYIDWYISKFNCENIRNTNIMIIKANEYNETAILSLKYGFGSSIIIMMIFYILRWILTGKIKPFLPTKNSP